jgi:hypothetical protein
MQNRASAHKEVPVLRGLKSASKGMVGRSAGYPAPAGEFPAKLARNATV